MIVGAGPGGLEAARVAAERGHNVTVFEAASDPGGQVRLTARQKRRSELIGIIDWRMAQCAARDVAFQFNTLADADDVKAMSPDVVIVATGGMQEVSVLTAGNDLAVPAWDIISGDVAPGENVLIYDEAGDPAGLTAAQIVAQAGGKVEIITRDRSFAPEIMGMNLAPYLEDLQRRGAVMTIGRKLDAIARADNQLCATLGTDYSDYTDKKVFDQIIVNEGVTPLDDLYFDLKPHSRNLGELDWSAIINGQGVPFALRNADASFDLYRIGDAVSARNTHAAIFDALRVGIMW